MKKIKILVLFIMIFILSGCTLDYNVTIDSNGKVHEEGIINFENGIIDPSLGVEYVLDNKISAIKNDSELSKYNIKKNIGKESSSVVFSRSYPNIEAYATSPVLKIAFNNIEVSSDSIGTYFKTIGNYNKNDVFGSDTEPEPMFDSINIKYKFMNNIVSNNSNNYNEKENTITYELNDKIDKFYIQFEYDNSKKYDIIIKEYLSNNISGLIIVIILIGAVISISVIIGKKSIESNKI